MSRWALLWAVHDVGMTTPVSGVSIMSGLRIVLVKSNSLGHCTVFQIMLFTDF
jgi:hypothetical protein